MMGDGNDTSTAVGMESQLPVQTNEGVEEVSARAEETPMARINPTARIQNVLRMLRTPLEAFGNGISPDTSAIHGPDWGSIFVPKVKDKGPIFWWITDLSKT